MPIPGIPFPIFVTADTNGGGLFQHCGRGIKDYGDIPWLRLSLFRDKTHFNPFCALIHGLAVLMKHWGSSARKSSSPREREYA
jgi:hypothetical protein